MMLNTCVIFNCHNHNIMNNMKLSFFHFLRRDKSPDRRDAWLAACGQQNLDKSH